MSIYLHVCLYNMYVPVALRGQKGLLKLLELELDPVVNLCLYVRNSTQDHQNEFGSSDMNWFICKKSKSS